MLLSAFALSAVLLTAETPPPARVATFSIAARDPGNGDMGVAVQSKFPNVRVAVPYAKAGVGAVATQSFANSDFGTRGLQLLALGATPQEVLTIVGRDDPDLPDRQVGLVDVNGRSATFTGKKCFDWAGGRTGPDYAIQGNILVSEATVAAMERAFLQTKGPLADRLLVSIKAGAEAGGDKRGRQSAALLVVREGASYDGKSDAYIDISVYDARRTRSPRSSGSTSCRRSTSREAIRRTSSRSRERTRSTSSASSPRKVSTKGGPTESGTAPRLPLSPTIWGGRTTARSTASSSS